MGCLWLNNYRDFCSSGSHLQHKEKEEFAGSAAARTAKAKSTATKRFLSSSADLNAMKLTIDTKEDSHDDLRKVIKMLQHIVGDSQEVFSNQPTALSQAADSSPFTNIFGDASSPSSMPESAAAMNENTPSTESQSETSSANPSASSEETSSTEDLFAELFNEEELKKMDIPKEEEPEIKPKDKKYKIEFY